MTDKKTLILEAVCDLIKKDVPAADMRMADIAVAAGIAKSTVYEYFSSKDELVANAIIHYAESTAKGLADNIPSGGTLASRMEALFDSIDGGIECPFPIYRIISPDSKAMELLKNYQAQNKFDLRQVFLPMLYKLVGDDDPKKCLTTLGAVLSYIAYTVGMYTDISRDDARAVCIKMALNV